MFTMKNLCCSNILPCSIIFVLISCIFLLILKLTEALSMHLLRQVFLLNPVITRVIDNSIGIYICYSFPEKLNHAEVLDHNETIRGVLVGME